MSMSSPYGQNGNQSPLGGPSMFGAQNWGNWQQPQGGAMTGGGIFNSPAPQPQPAQAPLGVTADASQPTGGATGTSTGLPLMPGQVQSNISTGLPLNQVASQSSGGLPLNQIASQSSGSGSSVVSPTDPTNMMIKALAQPTPQPANPAAFAPQNAAPVSASPPVAQPQNPYGF
jgi:hypothetical protein